MVLALCLLCYTTVFAKPAPPPSPPLSQIVMVILSNTGTELHVEMQVPFPLSGVQMFYSGSITNVISEPAILAAGFGNPTISDNTVVLFSFGSGTFGPFASFERILQVFCDFCMEDFILPFSNGGPSSEAAFVIVGDPCGKCESLPTFPLCLSRVCWFCLLTMGRYLCCRAFFW